MPPPDALKRLSSFYLGCIQEEGLRRLAFRSNQRGKKYVSPSLGRETLLHDRLDALLLTESSRPATSFIAKARGDQGPNTSGQDRLFYGYPTYVDDEHTVSPVFFAEVDVVDEERRGGTRIRRRDEDALFVNHHLLRQEGLVPEQIAAVQERVEQEGRTFHEKLQLFLQYVDVRANPDWRNANPLPKPVQTGLFASPLLFTSAYSPYTYNLERDLVALDRYGFLQRDVTKTALAPYLMPSHAPTSNSSQRLMAEVLPLNEEQEAAVQAAQTRALTTITGPPGTGKSQVVVNLLTEAIFAGKPVLFASKNNKAVDVVRDRLRAILGERFDFVLRLGSRSVINETREELRGRLRRLDDDRESLKQRCSKQKAEVVRDHIQQLRERVDALDAAHSKWGDAVKRREEAEQQLPENWAAIEPPGRSDVISQRELRRLLDRAHALAGNTRLGLWLWLKRLLFGARLLNELRDDIDALVDGVPMDVEVDVRSGVFGSGGFDDLVDVLERVRRYRTWIECRGQERRTNERLQSLLGDAPNYDTRRSDLKAQISTHSKELLRIVWVGRIVRNLPDVLDRFDGYFRAIEGVRRAGRSGYKGALDRLESATSSLGRFLPVWIETNLSVRNALPLRPGLFDLVIVDEASQCDIASAVPLLYRARRSAVIGDPKQLRHITTLRDDDERRLIALSNVGDLMPTWSYVGRSLFDVAEQVQGEGGGASILLRRHYRSHPAIITFSNERFYAGRLRPMRDASDFDVPEMWRGVRWFDVEGTVPKTRRSAYNETEIQAVVDLLSRWVEDGLIGAKRTVGVVTPFRAQADRLGERIRQQPWWRDLRADLEVARPIPVGTAHRFQGDERDMMIFSPVVAPGIKPYTARWVATTDQLLNVAITRARGSLQVVGHLAACREAGGSLEALAEYMAQYSLIEGV